MSTRATHRPLHHRLASLHSEHALRRVLRVALRAAAALIVAATVAVLAGLLLPVSPATARARALLLALAAGLAAWWAIGRVRRTSLSLEGFQEQIEAAFPALRSWLRNALDFEARPPQGTSVELAQALRDEAARRFAETPVAALRPRLSPRKPALVAAGSLAVLTLAALLQPTGTSLAWRTLWQPDLAAPPVRIAVEPGSVKVTPGASLVVRARVWGSDRAPRLVRDRRVSELAAEPEGQSPDGARLWRFELAQLTRPSSYRVRAMSAQSPEYAITLAGEPQPVGFEIEMHSPAYARLPVQRGAAARGDLEALRGARAVVEVTFDRDLVSLESRIVNGTPLEFREVTPRRWRGEVPVRSAGEYQLAATAPSGKATVRYPIRPLDDAPPLITVRVPEHDLELPAGQQIPLEVLAQDDLGLTELRLQFRKDAEGAWTNVPLARFAGEPREGQVASRWDASQLGLLPGEQASFRFALYDNNRVNGPGVALSPVFELRFPSLGELYRNLDETQAGVQQALEKVAEQTRELQKNLERMERQAPRANATSTPAFERSQEMKSALERQQDISKQMNQAVGELKQSLEQAVERDAFREELQRKLQEMAELMRQIESPEFRETMRKMQEALERMDRRAMEQHLPELREQNKEMLANLERTIELLKNLRQEEQLEALAKRAEDLAKRQDALNQQHKAPESREAKQAQAERKDRSERQQGAAKETEQLAQDTREMGKELASPQEKQQSGEAAEELEKNAEPQQEEAAQQAGDNKPSQASQSGQKASESLRAAAQKMQKMVQQRQQQRESVDLAAVRRAAQDLLSIQREAERNMSSSVPLANRADRQSDLSDGTARVADSLASLSERTPFISPQLHEALGHAIENLGQSGRDMDSGNRQRGEEMGVAGSTALNQAVLELRKAENSMCPKPGPSQGNQNSMPQRMGKMGEEQSRLNQETQGISRRLSQQMETTLGDRQEMERIGREQQRLRQQLEQMGREQTRPDEPKLLGRLDQVQREMKEVEEQLRQGVTSGELEEKQNRILSRLLDAQRSVNRRDFDPQREARAGEEVIRSSPGALPEGMLRENDRLRLDLLKAEGDRYPAQYRGLIESYLRSLNGQRR
ncbi:MAG: hypothetical protein ABIS67_07745 [Candidatus Eisenbacteria bacterium]